jgi:hypothetical protein
VWLNPAKGFSIERLETSWRPVTTNGGTVWQEWRFNVRKYRQVHDVWVPAEARLLSMGSVSERTDRGVIATVHDMHVDEMQLGSVSKDDLNVAFPPGTLVQDMLKGAAFAVEKGGKQRVVTTVLERPSKMGALREVARSGPRPWLTTVMLNLVLVSIGMSLLILYRKRRQ